jgi:hypothetical protein
MIQEILLILIFIGALVWLGRFFYRANSGKQDDATCDKCVPKQKVKKN